MRTALCKLDKCTALVAPPPARLLPYLQNCFQLPIIGTVLSYGVSIPLTHDANSRLASATYGLKRVFGVDFGPRRYELSARWIGAEYP